VDDHKPIFSSSIYSVTISELLTLGSFVVEVIVTDNDLPIPQIPVFSITSGNDLDSFMITNAISSPLHGNITVKNNLSYDVMNEYILKIRASSGSFVTSDIDVSITLINELNETNLLLILLACLIVAAIVIIISIATVVPLVTVIVIKYNQVHKRKIIITNTNEEYIHVKETAMAEEPVYDSISYNSEIFNTNKGIDIKEAEYEYIDEMGVNTQNNPAISNTNEDVHVVIKDTEESVYEHMVEMDVINENNRAISNTKEGIDVEESEYEHMDEMDVNTKINPAYALTSIS
jgi:hypothetical protein